MTLEFFETDEGSNAIWKRRAYEGKPLYDGRLQKSCGQKFSFVGYAGWFAAKLVTSDSGRKGAL